jgi:hypothetical protein
MELPDDELDQTRELCRDVIGARCPACKRTLLTLMLGLLVLLFAPRLSAAGVSGKWNGYFTTTVNPNQTVFLLELKNSAGKLTGKITFCGHACDPERSVDVGIEDARMSRNRVSFYVATGEPDVPILGFKGMISGDSFKFIVIGKSLQCGRVECQIGQGSASRTH